MAFMSVRSAALLSMTPQQIALLVLSILLVLFIVILIAVSVKLKKIRKREDAEYADEVKIIGGERYSKDGAVSENGEDNISRLPGDFLLVRGEIYRAERGGPLMPGVYTVLSAEGGNREINIRTGGYVRTFFHGDKIVIPEGDEVCAVSGNAVLR